MLKKCWYGEDNLILYGTSAFFPPKRKTENSTNTEFAFPGFCQQTYLRCFSIDSAESLVFV